MKFVALLSGGKDSCYNIIKCQSYGHELVCLANLFPTNTDEINSFMYQSVGHNAIPLLAKCFNVPLIRKEITGSAIEQRLQYDKAIVNDEVEDLYELLLTVKNKFPDVEGVSCGAIVSSYQRFRVENICNRLQLVPLSYLWQRDRSELLTEMIDSKVDAVLIKVAGAGLDPYKHLSKSLSSLQSTLFKLNQNFGLDLCGEGGEYETIVLDCSAFYHNKLSLDSTEIVIDEEDCSVGYLRIHECSVVEKEYQQELLSPPSLYEELKLMLPSIEPLAEVKESSINFSSTSKVRPNNDSSDKLTSIDDIFVGFSKLLVSDSDDLRSYVKISVNGFGQTALICPSTIVSTNGFSDDAIATQVNEVMTVMKRLLEYVSSTMNDIVFVHLYIANTSLFGAINGTYCQWFGVNPPSRSCVAVIPVANLHSLTVRHQRFVLSYRRFHCQQDAQSQLKQYF